MTSPGTLLPNGQRTGLSVETNPSAILAFDSTLTNRLLNEFRVGGVKRGENLQNPDSNRYLKQGAVNFNGLGGPGRGKPIDTELADIFTPAVITFADNMTWTKVNFAPNVGFNWDPFNDGKWSFSADYRLAYDRHYFTNTLFTVISQE